MVSEPRLRDRLRAWQQERARPTLGMRLPEIDRVIREIEAALSGMNPPTEPRPCPPERVKRVGR
jgi:hypothetical protein